MSIETHHYYGFSLTEHYKRIQDILRDTADIPSDLNDLIWENELGESHYHGGIYSQVTFIGRDVPMSERGIVVTDELEAEVKALIADLPSELRTAIIKVLGKVPEPKFDYEHSEG